MWLPRAEHAVENKSGGNGLIAVAIDKDKGSHHALKWATEKLLYRGQTLILIHVVHRSSSSGVNLHSATSEVNGIVSPHRQNLEKQTKEFFLTFHIFCTRKDIHCHDVILEGTDIAKTIAEYVSCAAIDNLVLGATSRHGFIKRFKISDIPSQVLKAAPDFCTIYVISKTKISSVRNASRPAPFNSPLHSQLQLQRSATSADSHSPSKHSYSLKAPLPADRTTPRSYNKGREVHLQDDTESIRPPFNRGRASQVKLCREFSETDTDISFGTRDFAKEQMAIREKAFSIIVEVFKRHGAMALDTPAFELRETLMGKYGEDSKLIYDLADQGGELCSLRYDLTVPFARYIAMNGITSFKRYQIAKVYRRDNPSKGRYREFYQCDFDIAGQYETMGPDFEVIKVMTELLDELNVGDYEIKLNHRKLLDGMLDICGVTPEKFRTICSSIDKLDKQSFEQIKKEMVEEKGLTIETADKIGTFVKERGPPLELLSKLKHQGSEFLENEGSLVALNELEILFKALKKSKSIDKVVFDLSLARGLDYYTGVIFEAVFKGATQVGSIAAGGRYDNLIGMFGAKQVPAVGISLGIERVFTIMEHLQKDRNEAVRPTETQVLVAILGDDLSLAAELVSELWNARLKAEYAVSKRVMKHIERAKASKIPWMVIVGERELTEGVVKLKDVEAAKEVELPRDRLVEELQRRLSP